MKYRTEDKFIISYEQMIIIEKRIENIAKLDRPEYKVKSLYFDDNYNSFYYDNENGVNPRKKIRIRTYNDSLSLIKYEEKYRERDKIYKKIKIISKSDAEYISKREFKVHPITIVEYLRKAYIYKLGNVRITFDRNISSSSYVDMFMEKDYPKRAILPLGYVIMEVKYDEFIPNFLKQLIQLDTLQQSTFSKYYLSRKISLQGALL